jgi:hypothetical protein
MNKAVIADLVADFQKGYDAKTKDAIWQKQSLTFRSFWSELVLGEGTGAIPDDVCDMIIRILDRHGKGNTRNAEAVARVMVPQGVWRRMLNGIHFDRGLAQLIDSIFRIFGEFSGWDGAGGEVAFRVKAVGLG